MPVFELHPRLKQDTLFVTDLLLSTVLLMNDARFPWLVLVPKRSEITELHALEADDLYQLSLEIKQVSQLLETHFNPDKLNVASIGNIVSQLHIHIVARYKSDPVWPLPVFGQGTPVPYSNEKAQGIIEALKTQL